MNDKKLRFLVLHDSQLPQMNGKQVIRLLEPNSDVAMTGTPNRAISKRNRKRR